MKHLGVVLGGQGRGANHPQRLIPVKANSTLTEPKRDRPSTLTDPQRGKPSTLTDPQRGKPSTLTEPQTKTRDSGWTCNPPLPTLTSPHVYNSADAHFPPYVYKPAQGLELALAGPRKQFCGGNCHCCCKGICGLGCGCQAPGRGRAHALAPQPLPASRSALSLRCRCSRHCFHLPASARSPARSATRSCLKRQSDGRGSSTGRKCARLCEAHVHTLCSRAEAAVRACLQRQACV